MKLSEAMNGITPSADFEGYTKNDDFILAVNTADTTSTTDTEISDYSVVQVGVTKADGSLDAETKDTQYIRTGKYKNKTGTQRKFSVEGDRYIGDTFQDFCMGFKIMFGKGKEVERKYVYFNILTGKGEKGTLTIIPSDTQTGDPIDSASFKVEMTSTSTPTEYTYSAS